MNEAGCFSIDYLLENDGSSNAFSASMVGSACFSVIFCVTQHIVSMGMMPSPTQYNTTYLVPRNPPPRTLSGWLVSLVSVASTCFVDAN